MDAVTIYHNPHCSNSRNALALIRHAGIEPTVIEYLKTPLDVARLRALVQATGEPARALLRAKETLATELGLNDPAATDEHILVAMAEHPVLMNRPVVSTPLGTCLCRPCDRVLALLPVGPLPPFTMENGELVIDSGERLPAQR